VSYQAMSTDGHIANIRKHFQGNPVPVVFVHPGK